MDAERYVMRLVAGVLIISANASAAFAQLAPPRPPRSTSCRPYEVVRRTYDGDYDGALALSEECAESHMRLVNPAGLVLGPGISDQPAHSASWAHAFLCATAQLQALTGDTRAARTAAQIRFCFLDYEDDKALATYLNMAGSRTVRGRRQRALMRGA